MSGVSILDNNRDSGGADILQYWRHIQRTSVSALATFWFASTGQAQNATSYQIDPAHDGAVTTTAPFQPPLKQLWSVAFSTPFVSYPIIAQDMVFINCDTSLYALSAKTGSILWHKQIIKFPDTSFFMTYDNGTVFELNNCNCSPPCQGSIGLIWYAALI